MGNSSSSQLDYSYTNHEDDDEFPEISLQDVNKSTVQCDEESVADILCSIDRDCDLLIHKWKAEQAFLKSRLKLSEDLKFLENVKLIGGVDISFPQNKEDLVHACVCLVVLSYPDLEVKYKKCHMVHLSALYIPGYLAFREVEPIHLLCNELKQNKKELYPQVIFVDGNGVLHPKKFGLACHLGVVLNLPTVGVAKKLFHVDGLEKSSQLKSSFKESLLQRGDTYELQGNSGFVYGKALRSTDHSSNPIFVSIGNKIRLDSAIHLVNNCCKFRVPEPVRLADQYSREYIRVYYDKHKMECAEQYQSLNSRFQSLSKEVEKRKLAFSNKNESVSKEAKK